MTSTAYCAVGDLLLGDVTVGGTINRQLYVDQAADEMDAKLGWLYETPIAEAVEGYEGPALDPSMPRHEKLLLKNINAKIATARLIMAVSINEEGNAVHAYALRMLKEGNDELLMIANGDLVLTAPRVETPSGTVLTRTPGVVNIDEESLLDPFYNTVNHSWPSYVNIGPDSRG